MRLLTKIHGCLVRTSSQISSKWIKPLIRVNKDLMKIRCVSTQ